MEFKVGTVTVEIINPEAIPIAQRKIAELIMEMARKEIEEESKKEKIQSNTSES
ncbi:hypothetical protein B0P06_002213 [Clostridium saccharoperbutylacetonicum]|uniref:Uncharacterized protein n=1 Tax=Clostridium saccharoperbutylacetonicum N1-4(HMT) TaxID=931276 RepID=M1MTK0_9CLOT|nr:hypothetical protein [Clostridium saccharoperbutylacetonicum]AGF59448.1 hypothetical protein Cspa_c57230 [Clostridium saccharoperbutylacetonicum N1-4(HMT)]NRT59759.1 hypothetical protein [Clostridium saccharoperbutylacetonicum]NSB23071.1 hypothetical protein [Clostridium saccharoperbutylacetonicum]NSB42442.1 hypothetical protein [Clostridium saccharoperbutylacetonicum]